jgi:hypothetical protein
MSFPNMTMRLGSTPSGRSRATALQQRVDVRHEHNGYLGGSTAADASDLSRHQFF